MAAANLTATRLRELLHYSPDTGEFTRAESKGRPDLVGKTAGSLQKCYGYVLISIGCKRFKAHRLAWLYCYGVWPKNDIDHKDGNRSNNRLSNLREATRSENNQNIWSAPKSSSSGLLGASWHPRARKWEARIKVKGRQHYLGLFPTPEEASAAYIAAKRRLHPFGQI